MNQIVQNIDMWTDPSLRLKARNLRAKVRSMLPLDICCKYQQRNTLVSKVEKKRILWDEKGKPNNNTWKYGKIDDSKWFSEKFHKMKPKHMFSKLTQGQIQQICDHKHYFVGEAHFKEFDQFLDLQSKQKKLQTTVSENSQIIETTKNKTQTTLYKTFRTHDLNAHIQDLKQRHSQVKLRFKNITDQFNNTRSTKKIITQLKLKKAEQNMKRINQIRQQEWIKKQQKMKEIHSKVSQRKTKEKQQKEITELTMELKQICSHRG